MFKRFIALLFCLILIFVSIPILGFTDLLCVPVYAGVNDDQIYVPLKSENDAVKAFQAYCKSRDLTIEGSSADAITTFTTSTFNFICNSIGIDITELQAEIKADYDNAGLPVKFAFTASGIDVMNRIFAQFLQDNELEVGDAANETNNIVYSGKTFTDLDGNTCLVYILNRFSTGGYDTENLGGELLAYGTPYKYSHSNLLALWDPNSTLNFHVATNYSYTGSFSMSGNLYKMCSFSGDSRNYFYIESTDPSFIVSGHYIIAYSVSQDAYYFGSYSNTRGTYQVKGNRFYIDQDNNVQNTVVYLTTNNTVINNNNYEGDTYITNEGDIYNPPVDTPPGGTVPGWDVNGGQGSSGDTIITFPDFKLPDLNIDWSIKGLGNKFPFSIPFDIASLVTVLNAEPEAPRFQGTVNFGFTTWNYDINLQQFDSVAHACRIAELLLLVFGLIMITRSIIKG